MARYKLSQKGLNSAFKKLLDKGLLYEKDFYDRPAGVATSGSHTTTVHDTVVVEDERDLLRLRPHVPIMIYGNHPGIKGEIQDISAKGVGIKGIDSSVGEMRSLVIMPEKFLPIEPIAFQAVCIWARHDEEGKCVAGFLFVDIPEEALKQIMKLMLFIEQDSE